MIVALDSTPAYLLVTRLGHPVGDGCREWADSVEARGDTLAMPAVIYYEVRRELFRDGARTRLRLLDRLRERSAFLEINLDTLNVASELWARARKEGRQTADDRSLDIDCILGAQALIAGAVVATGNVSHLGIYCDADPWDSI